jgi:type I restriction enzyme R subunit
MTEFKQIIGRGTRVRDDYGKYFFTILDYTGSATRHFADPEFDGEPALITEQEIDEAGQVMEEEVISPEEPSEGDEGETIIDWVPPEIIEHPPPGEPRKFYVDGGFVEIAAHLVYELDADGKQLRVVKYTDYAAGKLKALYASPDDLRQKWANPEQRREMILFLSERGIDLDELAAAAKQPDADFLDLLCHVAFNAPLRTRRERADRLQKEKKDFFDRYGPQARAILNDLLEKYVEHGTTQFSIPDVLKVPPISNYGNVMEIAAFFNGPERLREAVNQLQNFLYAA